ncbi:MAG: 50S ribosomal protein L4 [Planctomycetes bacterium]|nr:50S ribosomal protein L4 [Planctomycetota bacterium]
MASFPIYDQSGAPTGETCAIDPAEFAAVISDRLLHEAVVMYGSNQRLGTSKTKSRAEVIGSGKKMYKQKGTGNARMGNKRTPVRRGGGHCFAKRPRDWSYRLPRKALQRAAAMAFASKVRDGELFVLKSLTVTEPKTKPIAQMLNKIGVGEASCVIGIAEANPTVWKSVRNIERCSLVPATEWNAGTLLRNRYLVVTVDAIERFRARFAKRAV